jgi:hypothetical protein
MRSRLFGRNGDGCGESRSRFSETDERIGDIKRSAMLATLSRRL